MAELCYITTCKGRLEHLKDTLPRIVNQPGVSCVVVDFDCPDGTAAWVAAHFPQVRLVKVSDRPGFSAAQARNLGAAAADAPWLAFFDADIRLAPEFAVSLLPSLRPGHFYRAAPIDPEIWGSVICHRADFSAIGGYDEAFVGWGGEDDDLLARLSAFGCTAGSFPATLAVAISHGEATRLRFYDIKDRRVQHRVNQMYMLIKADLLRLTGAPLPLAERQQAFGEISRTIAQAAAEGRASATVDINLPALFIQPPPIDGVVDRWTLTRKFSYAVDLSAGHQERA